MLELSSEHRLVVDAARIWPPSDVEQQIQERLSETLDWPEVHRFLEEHRLGPLFRRTIRTLDCESLIPDALREHLDVEYLANAATSARQHAALVAIHDELEREQIPVVLLKGAALVQLVYPEAALRPMNDLDLLVPEPDLSRAARAVERLGFRPEADYDARKLSVMHHSPPLVSDDGLVTLELHRYLARTDTPLHFDVTRLWDRSKPLSIDGRATAVPAPEDLLLHLSLHFFYGRNRWVRGALGQVCDLLEVIEHYRPTLDWKLLTSEAESHGVTGPLYCALHTLRRIHTMSLPESLETIRPYGFSEDRVTAFIRQRVVGAEQWVVRDSVPHLDAWSLSRMLRTRWRRLFRSAWGRLFPPLAVLAERHPKASGSRAKLYLQHLLWLADPSKAGSPAEELTLIRSALEDERWFHAVYRSDRLPDD